MPVYGTIAARFNDDGVTALYQAIVARLGEFAFRAGRFLPRVEAKQASAAGAIVPLERSRYLAEIADCVRLARRQPILSQRPSGARRSCTWCDLN